MNTYIIIILFAFLIFRHSFWKLQSLFFDQSHPERLFGTLYPLIARVSPAPPVGQIVETSEMKKKSKSENENENENTNENGEVKKKRNGAYIV